MASRNEMLARGQGSLLWRQAIHAIGQATHLSQASLDQLGGGSRAIDKAARNIYKKYADFDWFCKTISGLLKYLRMDQWRLSEMIQQQYPNLLRWEAATEVLTDHLIAQEGDMHKALLIIVSDKYEHPLPTPQQLPLPFITSQQHQLFGQTTQAELPLLQKQHVVLHFVEALLKREALPNCCDGFRQFPLHHAVNRNFKNVVSKLLESNANTMEKDINGKLPLQLALKRDEDEIAAMVIKVMPNDEVIKLFIADSKNKKEQAQCSFHKTVAKKMTKTALAILDCMIDIDEDDQRVKLDYSLLESDAKGRSKEHSKFNVRDYTAFEKIALSDNKEIACHNLVKRLIKNKWNKFAKRRFILKFGFFLLSVIFMTFAAVTGVGASDPKSYETSLDKARAACEVFVLLMVLIKAGGELYQMGRNRWYYLRDIYNYFDLASIFCLVAVVPLRWYNFTEQWQVFGVGYLIWIFDVFKYAAITSKNYAYYEILLRLIRRVFPQFTVVFVIVLVAFSGSFLLALKGENALGFHDETSAYHKVLFTGIRILIEGQPAVDYTGPTGYAAVSTILMCAFLFVTLVVLLNILIAQLTDTYNKVQQKIEGGLLLTRMKTITKLEINSVFNKCCHRKSRELIEKKDLDEWNKFIKKVDEDDEDPNVRKIRENVESTQHDITTIKHELTRLEKMLSNVQTLLLEQSGNLNHRQSTTLLQEQPGALIQRQSSSSSSSLLPRPSLLQSQRYSSSGHNWETLIQNMT